jgi:predicted O-methyltransferase YrrM
MPPPTSPDPAERIRALEQKLAELADARDAERTWREPGHYYSPIPDVEQLRPHFDKLFFRHVGELPGIDMNFDRQKELMQAFLPFYAEQPFAAKPSPERRYHFENDQFSYADALFLYFVLRHVKPKRVVEVGTGWSTCAMLDTDDLFLGGELSITSIDPDPSRLRARMRKGDEERVSILEQPVQLVDLGTFDALQADDILFIDSTHVLKTGSDVNHLMFEVLPRLASGVWVHVHDITWPFEYPQEWVEEGRAWNEVYAWRAFLQFNDAFDVQVMNTCLEVLETDWFREHMPLCLENMGGSLWLRRR